MFGWGVAKLVAHLEGGGLLSGDAIGIDAVDQPNPHRVTLGQIAHDLQADIEVADNLDNPRSMHHALRKLAQRHRAFRDQHVGLETGAGRVGGGRRCGIAGRGADDLARAFAERLAHRDRHAAVLEGTGGVGALEFQVHLDIMTEARGERRALDKRRVALVERDDGRRLSDRQKAPVMFD